MKTKTNQSRNAAVILINGVGLLNATEPSPTYNEQLTRLVREHFITTDKAWRDREVRRHLGF